MKRTGHRRAHIRIVAKILQLTHDSCKQRVVDRIEICLRLRKKYDFQRLRFFR